MCRALSWMTSTQKCDIKDKMRLFSHCDSLCLAPIIEAWEIDCAVDDYGLRAGPREGDVGWQLLNAGKRSQSQGQEGNGINDEGACYGHRSVVQGIISAGDMKREGTRAAGLDPHLGREPAYCVVIAIGTPRPRVVVASYLWRLRRDIASASAWVLRENCRQCLVPTSMRARRLSDPEPGIQLIIIVFGLGRPVLFRKQDWSKYLSAKSPTRICQPLWTLGNAPTAALTASLTESSQAKHPVLAPTYRRLVRERSGSGTKSRNAIHDDDGLWDPRSSAVVPEAWGIFLWFPSRDTSLEEAGGLALKRIYCDVAALLPRYAPTSTPDLDSPDDKHGLAAAPGVWRARCRPLSPFISSGTDPLTNASIIRGSLLTNDIWARIVNAL
ncbi:hypothetical protein C8F01DRAFT_1351213 [Mycena amicta]|nr:hypothetical protein C8F01DRAFT_1351213 [Mycena amicta]